MPMSTEERKRKKREERKKGKQKRKGGREGGEKIRKERLKLLYLDKVPGKVNLAKTENF